MSIQPGRGVVAQARPVGGRRAPVDRLEGGVERPDAAEPRGERDLGHAEIGAVDQPLGALDSGGARRRERSRVEIAPEQPRQVAPSDPQPPGQRLDARLVERALVDQAERAIDRRPRAAPGRRMLRGLGPAAQAGPKARRLGGGRAREIADVARHRLAYRADGPAVDAGRGDGDEDHAVIGRIAGKAHAFAEIEVELGGQVGGPCHRLRL